MYCISALGILALAVLSSADYTMKVSLLNYEVPDGKLKNGQPCDPKLFFWADYEQCDLAFEVCIGTTNSEDENDATTCHSKWQDFGMVTFDNNKAVFGDKKYKDFANPSTFQFSGANEGLVIKVRVYDQDWFGKQLVDNFVVKVDEADVVFDKVQAISQDVERNTDTISGLKQSSINIQYTATCTTGAAPTCTDKVAKPSSCVHGILIFGNCICNPFSGYGGPECNTPKNPSKPNPVPVKPFQPHQPAHVNGHPAPSGNNSRGPGPQQPSKGVPAHLPSGPGPVNHPVPIAPGPKVPFPNVPSPDSGSSGANLPPLPGPQEPGHPAKPLGPIWPGSGVNLESLLSFHPGPGPAIVPRPANNDPHPFGPGPQAPSGQSNDRPLGPVPGPVVHPGPANDGFHPFGPGPQVPSGQGPNRPMGPVPGPVIVPRPANDDPHPFGPGPQIPSGNAAPIRPLGPVPYPVIVPGPANDDPHPFGPGPQISANNDHQMGPGPGPVIKPGPANDSPYHFGPGPQVSHSHDVDTPAKPKLPLGPIWPGHH